MRRGSEDLGFEGCFLLWNITTFIFVIIKKYLKYTEACRAYYKENKHVIFKKDWGGIFVSDFFPLAYIILMKQLHVLLNNPFNPNPEVPVSLDWYEFFPSTFL